MSDYTIKNLKDDVEDSAPKFGFSPTLESRFATGDLNTSELGLSYQRVAPNERSPFGHRHTEQPEELYVIVGGSGRVNVEGDIRDVRQWDAVRVNGNTGRAWEAGPNGLELLAFGMSGPRDFETFEPKWDGDSKN